MTRRISGGQALASNGWGLEFNSRILRVEFVMDRVTLGHAVLRSSRIHHAICYSQRLLTFFVSLETFESLGKPTDPFSE
jgi:hypothetical protein